jgi:phage-related protein
MADFPTAPLPSYPIAETLITPEVLVTKHRDGSQQRRLKGPGAKRTFKLKFGADLPISNAERLAIVTHFAGENGTLTSFNWLHPERGETILVRYSAAPTFEHAAYNSYNGAVELEEVPA